LDRHDVAGMQHYRSDEWEAYCDALADELGFARGVVWRAFEQLLGIRVIHSIAKLDRATHEDSAFRDVRCVFDKKGCSPD
jgi:hypothetical protein